MRFFVTGGTGLVGSRLIRRLRQRGDEVVLLSRRPATGPSDPGVLGVVGDPGTTGPWMDAVGDCDAVVNLVGENIFAKRWSDEFKETMRKSRVDSTRNVVQAMKRSTRPNRVLVSASAIGYYGPHGDEELTETSPPGSDYLARCCVEWEQ
ncbi:MAG TPA: NAD-dependent epimerase/dehydratase family protein, partial [Gemmataceae bacterium]|nr:NAD-dependent epimerase/dehydratase family protein [Gemmataceae bacterium]